MTTSEAKFWDRALTAEEIATLAKGGEVPGGQAVAPRHEEISMSDIVKRLRDVEAWCHVSTAKEAADEIERLRAAWQLIETCPGEKDVTYWGYGNGSQFVFYVGEHKGERRFYLDEADGYYRAYPTHWMTLPAPPQGKVP